MDMIKRLYNMVELNRNKDKKIIKFIYVKPLETTRKRFGIAYIKHVNYNTAKNVRNKYITNKRERISDKEKKITVK